jgi:hypothetical protein
LPSSFSLVLFSFPFFSQPRGIPTEAAAMAAVRAIEEDFRRPSILYGSAAAPLASARVRPKPRAALSRGATVAPFSDRARVAAWFGHPSACQRKPTPRSFPARWCCRHRVEGPGKTPCSSLSLVGSEISRVRVSGSVLFRFKIGSDLSLFSIPRPIYYGYRLRYHC